VTDVDRETEQRLVARLKAGDGPAFEAIYEAYRPRLFSFLVRLSRRRDVAEDLLEETWLRLIQHASTLRDEAQLAPWLFTVARNLYYSWRRSHGADPWRTSELDPAWPAPERGDSPFAAAVRSELEGRIEAGLARLSLADRELLLLVGVEGLTSAEAATVAGVPAVTVRARLHRARERLAAELGAGLPRAKAG
jgi:RNA polymerase sigma factor (sigma-70 family)